MLLVMLQQAETSRLAGSMDTPEHCRGSAGAVHSPHTLIKTHAWSSEWDPGTASYIFLTHRDLRGVLASYQRVGWAFDITPSYVQEHMRWRVRHNPHAAAVKCLVACSNAGSRTGLLLVQLCSSRR